MLENKKTANGVHYSRYIASWSRMGGQTDSFSGSIDDFDEWLKSLGLSDSDIDNISEMARNGKVELEMSAKMFIKQIKNT